MKKNNNAKIVIFILSIMFSLISCNLFIDKSEKVESIGYLNLNLSSSNNLRTVSPQLEVTSYNIIFSNGPVFRESITTSNSEQVIPLHTGSWDIHVDALNSAGDIVESGDLTDIFISIDSTLNKILILSPTAVGTGSVDLSISWKDSIGITGYDITMDGITISSDYYTESVDTDITNLRYNQDLNSGSYHFLLVLKKGDLILGNIYEVINVYDNLTSSKVITLSESDFTQIPNDPDSLIANEGLGCINVTWNDNSYVETGYIIERRVEGDADFTILDASLIYNTNSYVDYDIEQDITYEYRVKAFNTIGESGYTSVASSTLNIPDVTGLESDETPTQAKIFNWDSSDDTATFRYLINEYSTSPDDWSGASWTDSTSVTYDTNSGTFYLHVQSSDTAGNLSSVVTVSFVLDNTPPDDPSLTIISPTTDSTPTWNWTIPNDAVEVRYQLNGENSDSWIYTDISTTSYTSTTELTDGDHNLYIQTRDLLNNWSSSTISTINIDTTPPEVIIEDIYEWYSIITNLSASISDANDTTVLWEKEASSGSVIFGDATSSNTTIIGLDGEEGQYTITITATDSVGLSTSKTTEFKWDKKGPTPGNSGIISTSVVNASSININWSIATEIAPETNILYKLVGSTSNNISTISDAELETDGRFVVQDWTSGYYSGSVSGLTTGETYYFNVLAKDDHGNISIYNTVSQSLTGTAGITISTNRPWEESITFNKADGEVVNQTGSYSVSVNETFDSYSWELYGLDISMENEQAITINCIDLNPGIHTLFFVGMLDGELFSERINFKVEN